MKFALIITAEAAAEIKAVQQLDREAAAAAVLLIQELRDNPDMLEFLCVPEDHYDFTPAFEVKKYKAAIERGYNIYILKFRTLEGALPSYRLLIGYHAQENKYYVLQFPNREFDYSIQSPEFRELCRRYEECEIPCYK